MSSFDFITKPSQNKPRPGSPTVMPTPDTVSGILGSEVVLSTEGNLILILKGGYPIVQLTLKEIVNWEIAGATLYIYSTDSTPIALTFMSGAELTTGLSVIINALNA